MLCDVGVERGHLAGAHEVRGHVGDQHEVVLLELLGVATGCPSGRAPSTSMFSCSSALLEVARRCRARAGRRPRRRGRSACPCTGAVMTAVVVLRLGVVLDLREAQPVRRRAGVLGVALELDEVLALAQRRPSSTARGRWGTRPAGARASTLCASVDHTSAVTSYGWPTLMSSGTVTPTTRTSLVLSCIERAPRDLDAELLGAIRLDGEVALRSGCRRRRSPCAAGSRRGRGRRRAASPPGCRCRRRAPAWRCDRRRTASAVAGLRRPCGFSANVTSWRLPSPLGLLELVDVRRVAAASCLSEIESETSTSTTVATLLVSVIHDGRASAIASADDHERAQRRLQDLLEHRQVGERQHAQQVEQRHDRDRAGALSGSSSVIGRAPTVDGHARAAVDPRSIRRGRCRRRPRSRSDPDEHAEPCISVAQDLASRGRHQTVILR